VLGAGSTTERNLTTQYRYDAAGRVSRKIDANGKSTWFIYDDAGQLTYTIDPTGAVVQQFYDADGRVVQVHQYYSQVDTSGFGDVVTSITVPPTSADHRSYFVYDRDGNERYAVQELVPNVWTISEKVYDANRNVIEARRYDKFLFDQYDPRDTTKPNPVDMTKTGLTMDDMSLELTAMGYTDASKLSTVERTRYVYNADNQVRFIVDAMGGVTENVYDGGGNVIMNVRYATAPTLSAYDEGTINGAVDR